MACEQGEIHYPVARRIKLQVSKYVDTILSHCYKQIVICRFYFIKGVDEKTFLQRACTRQKVESKIKVNLILCRSAR